MLGPAAVPIRQPEPLHRTPTCSADGAPVYPAGEQEWVVGHRGFPRGEAQQLSAPLPLRAKPHGADGGRRAVLSLLTESSPSSYPCSPENPTPPLAVCPSLGDRRAFPRDTGAPSPQDKMAYTTPLTAIDVRAATQQPSHNPPWCLGRPNWGQGLWWGSLLGPNCPQHLGGSIVGQARKALSQPAQSPRAQGQAVPQREVGCT